MKHPAALRSFQFVVHAALIYDCIFGSAIFFLFRVSPCSRIFLFFVCRRVLEYSRFFLRGARAESPVGHARVVLPLLRRANGPILQGPLRFHYHMRRCVVSQQTDACWTTRIELVDHRRLKLRERRKSRLTGARNALIRGDSVNMSDPNMLIFS